jgi:hypothetical protein
LLPKNHREKEKKMIDVKKLIEDLDQFVYFCETHKVIRDDNLIPDFAKVRNHLLKALEKSVDGRTIGRVYN